MNSKSHPPSKRAAKSASAATTSKRGRGSLRGTSEPSVVALDNLDRQVLSALRENGRLQNKAMAKLFGVTELTIAARLRKLTDNGIVRATAQWDFAALGYHEIMFIDIWVHKRAVEDVAADIGQLEESFAVLGLLGEPQLKIVIAARDSQHRQDLIFNSIYKIRGVSRIEIVISLDIVKWRADYVLVL